MFMKANHLLPIAAFCLMTASCNTGKQQAELTAGIQLANLDTTALPGTDFLPIRMWRLDEEQSDSC